MRLIVGLGNPGAEYDWTPHNIGFQAIDALAERSSIRVTRPECKAHIGRGTMAGEEVILAKPQTYMNLSGVAVRMLLEKYDAGPAEMIVLVDDVDLPWGTLRIRERGSAGTHNGLKSIISSVGTQEFIRVRLGVGPEKVWGDLRDYVLHAMNKAERETAAQVVADAIEAVETILGEGISKAMNQFNRKAPPSEEASN
ncbi:MAG TPA: aminoacyl-tRNA hydrolase [Candidatus Acidoferrales bacterium]|jgi:PTH1 family peptidyl-tRNA hydrolase|nr:aminoacyl-tRNA hydrolase [Candidatus Acidoferrales bacterium]